MKRAVGMLLAAVGMFLLGASLVVAASPSGSNLKFRSYAPAVSRAEAPTPTPTTPPPTPTPYIGAVASLSLASAGISSSSPVEARDVDRRGGSPTFQEPTHPSRIAWYNLYGIPGWRGNNSIFAAHINYVGYGNGPFARLTSAVPGDALYVTMANGASYAYTVKSVSVVHLADLDMTAVVYPPLDSQTERVTLISCGGTFVPYPGGGGEYDSRVILVAERFVP